MIAGKHPNTQAYRDQIRQRRADVARLLALGLRHREIGERLGLGRGIIGRDIARLRQEWRELSVESYEAKAEAALEWFGNVHRQALEAWEKSKGTVEKKKAKRVTEGGEEKTEVVVETEVSLGDPRYLALANKAAENLTRIIGAEKPIKHSLTDADGNAIPFAIVRFEERPSRALGAADGDVEAAPGE